MTHVDDIWFESSVYVMASIKVSAYVSSLYMLMLTFTTFDNKSTNLVDVVSVMGLSFVVAFIFVLLGCALFGGPVYLLLRSRKKATYWAASAIGAIEMALFMVFIGNTTTFDLDIIGFFILPSLLAGCLFHREYSIGINDYIKTLRFSSRLHRVRTRRQEREAVAKSKAAADDEASTLKTIDPS